MAGQAARRSQQPEVKSLFPIIRRIVRTAALAAAVCGATACLAPQTAEQRSSDRAAVEAIQAEFAADPTLYSRHITVHVRNGVATLDGYAWTTEEITAATQDAQRASGVSKVVNNIQVDRGAVQDSGVAR